MRCIYLDGKYCKASVTIDVRYTPESEILKEFCQTSDFNSCPRNKAYLAYLQAKAQS